MKIIPEYSLKKYNSFGIEAKAKSFVNIEKEASLQTVIATTSEPIFILGGGSNILLCQDVDGLVLKNNIKGKKLLRSFKHQVHVAVGGGENWHEFVRWCIDQNYGGVENLSLIPGTVGAAPIQNIGAYGVELKDIFVRLEAIELKTGERHIFRLADCAFGYRDSVFKRQYKGKYCITKVVFRLSKTAKVNVSYGAIQATLTNMGVTQPDIRAISDAVIHIRQSKLPDPAVLGNAGSFFKNPVLSKNQFERLQTAFPSVVYYDLPDGTVKVPAGWLIEQSGWKGKRVGNTGSHKNQALVLVNYGNATGKEIYTLAMDIIASVKQKFGVQLTPEVNIW
ncbi:MAG: UDP-N-acetylmuramate dehydrogenase [Saprospiraceae bacterium]